MDLLPDCYGIIPTRYASSRFEGKPLALILGKPMFWHVYNRTRQCTRLSKVMLATDDQRIMVAAQNLDVPVLMTSASHTCGTERVLEAARLLDVAPDAVVINIQGDEPTLEPAMLEELILPFLSSDVQVTTLAREIDFDEAHNADVVKVVLDNSAKALYFSRAPIPYPRDGKQDGFHAHIGIYAFRMQTLETFVSLQNGVLEKKEKLEQLRLLENGIPIHVVKTTYKSHGVDRPEDIELVTKIMANS
ncbi:MAG: 3-deoxy-D-manno-octulosonate cytidylyltransferase [Desulfobulbaceae bacterium DB1]|nr:MAG: 3-deoxy-D-manno-octulosonate cytidylyltransferase [Desulfobulbaceae bacterium DB1]